MRLTGEVAPLLSLPEPPASAGLAGLPLDGVAGALSGSVGTGILTRTTKVGSSERSSGEDQKNTFYLVRCGVVGASEVR